MSIVCATNTLGDYTMPTQKMALRLIAPRSRLQSDQMLLSRTTVPKHPLTQAVLPLKVGAAVATREASHSGTQTPNVAAAANTAKTGRPRSMTLSIGSLSLRIRLAAIIADVSY